MNSVLHDEDGAARCAKTQEGLLIVFNIQVRDVPGQIVASERAVKRQDELEAWLPGAMSRVAQVAIDRGGSAGTDIQTYPNRGEFAPEPVFIVIYDGNPSDGPMTVEVTAPVIPMDDAATTSAGRQVRHVPAYREAFVRLARSEAEPSELRNCGGHMRESRHRFFLTDWRSRQPPRGVFH